MLKTLCLILSINAQVNQDTIPLVDSNSILQTTLQLREKANYKETVPLLKSITPLDSNFLQAQSELIFAYDKLESYDSVKLIGDELLKRSDLTSQIYITLGNAYLNSKEASLAMETYQEGLRHFPYNYILTYNVGLCYYTLERYEESIGFLIKSININPFYKLPHQILGHIMAKGGYRTKAMLSYLTLLAISPNENWALVRLNDLVNNAYREEGTAQVECDNSEFDYYDNLIKSKLVYDERYRSDIAFKAPVAQQSELLIKKIKYVPNTNDFWMDFYVPFLNQIAQNNFTPALIYNILSSTDHDDVKKWIKKNEKEINGWINTANNQFYLARQQHERTVMDSTGLFRHWYFDDNHLNAIGREHEDNKVGPFEYYHRNGRLSAIGKYSASGNKIGLWKYYHDNGQLKSVEEFDHLGNLNGKTQSFDVDGNLISTGNYVQDKVQGFWEWYYVCGTLKEQYPYNSGIGEGEGKVYYESGEVKTVYHLSEGKLHGKYTTYYRSGQINDEFNYVKGNVEGDYLSYYANGAVYKKGNYTENTPHGNWMEYHLNGKLSSKGEYVSGKKDSEWNHYYADGKIQLTEQYGDGNLIKEELYGEDGKLHSEREYTDDRMVSYKYFARSGSLLSEGVNDEGNMPFTAYYPSGGLQAEGTLVNGKLNGEYTTYHSNGNVYQKGSMLNNSWNAEYKEYNAAGKILVRCNYEKGELTGYYRRYFKNGKIAQEGWLVNGDIQQKWHEYFLDGSLRVAYTYDNGIIQGLTKYFDNNGRLSTTENYENGILVEVSQYDTLGNVFNKVELPKSGGEIVLKSINGMTIAKSVKVCGQDLGNQITYYPSGSIETEYRVSKSQFTDYKYLGNNGKILIKGHFLNDHRDGDWIYYHDNGNVSSQSKYLLGNREGKSIQYYYNGVIESECEYQGNEKHGLCKFYGPSKDLQLIKLYDKSYGLYAYLHKLSSGVMSDTIFTENNKEEIIEAYYSNGQPSTVQHYKNGLFDGEVNFYNEDGKLISQHNYLDGDLHGINKDYYPNGNLKREAVYYYNEEHGVQKEYYENGRLQETSNWTYGIQNGATIKYNRDGTVNSEIYYWNGNVY